MREYWDLPPEELFRPTGVDWLQHLLGQLDGATKAKTILVLWCAWHQRNDCIHQKGDETIARSVNFLKTYSSAPNGSAPNTGNNKGKLPLFRTMTGSPSTGYKPGPWTAPPLGWIKLNTNGSFFSSPSSGGAGAIARDSDGSMIFAA